MIRQSLTIAGMAAMAGCFPIASNNEPDVFHSTMAPEAATECLMIELDRANPPPALLSHSVAPRRVDNRQMGTMTVREIVPYIPVDERHWYSVPVTVDHNNLDYYRISIYPESTGSRIELRQIFQLDEDRVVPPIEACGGQSFAGGIS